MFLYSFIAAAIAAVLAVVMSFFADRKPLTRGILVLIVCFLVDLGVLYFFMPLFSYFAIGAFPGLFFTNFAIVGISFVFGDEDSQGVAIFSVILWIVIGAAWLLIANVFVSPGIGDPGHDRLAELINVEDSTTAFADTKLDQIIRVSPEIAVNKAQRALQGDLGTYLGINRAYLQEVSGHWYYIVDFKVTSWRGFRTAGSVVPGYIVVDAMNTDAEAQLRLGYKMQYVPDARWDKDLERYFYLNFLINSPYRVDDLTGLEVDDNWNPYYTGTLLRYQVGWKGMVVDSVVTVDPQSGKIEQYALDKVPSWVNRIYSQDLIGKYAKWWATYKYWDIWKFMGEAGKRKIDLINDVVTSEGLEYQITLTSVGADSSLTEIIYFNPRTGKAVKYPIKGATVESVTNLMEEASKRVSAAGFKPVGVELHYLLGQPVWYGILLGRASAGTDGREALVSGSYSGVAFVQAKYSSDQTKVIIATTLQEAYDQLRRQIAQEETDTVSASKERLTQQVDGLVTRKVEYVAKDGTRFYRFTISTTIDSRVLYFQVGADNDAASWMITGDTVTVTYYTTSSPEVFWAVEDIVVKEWDLAPKPVPTVPGN